MTSKLDRSEINRALAKTIAYHDCGRTEKSLEWAAQLMRELKARNILRPEWQNSDPT